MRQVSHPCDACAPPPHHPAPFHPISAPSAFQEANWTVATADSDHGFWRFTLPPHPDAAAMEDQGMQGRSGPRPPRVRSVAVLTLMRHAVQGYLGGGTACLVDATLTSAGVAQVRGVRTRGGVVSGARKCARTCLCSGAGGARKSRPFSAQSSAPHPPAQLPWASVGHLGVRTRAVSCTPAPPPPPSHAL